MASSCKMFVLCRFSCPLLSFYLFSKCAKVVELIQKSAQDYDESFTTQIPAFFAITASSSTCCVQVLYGNVVGHTTIVLQSPTK